MGPLIMIADDAMFMRKVVKRALTEGGYDRFLEAGSGEEAVEFFRQHHPDLVILDITMPGMSGLEVLDAILNADKGAKVIMCSAIGQEHIIAQAIRRGASDFLIKPFRNRELLKIVEASL